jgi:hypothetical protein
MPFGRPSLTPPAGPAAVPPAGPPAPRRFDPWQEPPGEDRLPGVTDPDQGREEYLPIFAAVESAWFRRPEPVARPAVPPEAGAGDEDVEDVQEISAAAAKPAVAGPPERPGGGRGEGFDPWRFQADAGWQAAEAVKEPTMGGITAAGLPKRTPKANLVPGSVGREAVAEAPRPAVSADRIRNRLAGFQEGLRRARADAAGGAFERSVSDEEES